MEEKKRQVVRELWNIREEAGDDVENLTPEDQLEYFHRGADEAVGTLERVRKRKKRPAQARLRRTA